MCGRTKKETKIKKTRETDSRCVGLGRHVCKEHKFEYFIEFASCVVRLHAVDSHCVVWLAASPYSCMYTVLTTGAVCALALYKTLTPD